MRISRIHRALAAVIVTTVAVSAVIALTRDDDAPAGPANNVALPATSAEQVPVVAGDSVIGAPEASATQSPDEPEIAGDPAVLPSVVAPSSTSPAGAAPGNGSDGTTGGNAGGGSGAGSGSGSGNVTRTNPSSPSTPSRPSSSPAPVATRDPDPEPTKTPVKDADPEPVAAKPTPTPSPTPTKAPGRGGLLGLLGL